MKHPHILTFRRVSGWNLAYMWSDSPLKYANFQAKSDQNKRNDNHKCCVTVLVMLFGIKTNWSARIYNQTIPATTSYSGWLLCSPNHNITYRTADSLKSNRTLSLLPPQYHISLLMICNIRSVNCTLRSVRALLSTRNIDSFARKLLDSENSRMTKDMVF